ncbi:hypothetical protein OG216_17600 [Streptomycetaceae bacterium NBC_01309]
MSEVEAQTQQTLPGSSVWFIPLPGFHQVAISGRLDELRGRCEEYVREVGEGESQNAAIDGVNSVIAMVNSLFANGVCYLATGLFGKDDGGYSTANLALSVIETELPEGGATQLALAGIVEAKWGCDPKPVDVPAGPAVAWSDVVRIGLDAAPGAAPPPELPEVHQMHVAVVHPDGRRIAVLQCSTTDAGEVDSYQAMVDVMAATIWFDGESPYFREEPEPSGAGPDFRSVLG